MLPLLKIPSFLEPSYWQLWLTTAYAPTLVICGKQFYRCFTSSLHFQLESVLAVLLLLQVLQLHHKYSML